VKYFPAPLYLSKDKILTKQLKITQKGSGSALLVLHGWGMNQSVWQNIAPQLEACFTVYWVDLPGHGQNHAIALHSLERSSTLIVAKIPDNTSILAWSLGGLIAQQIALQYPHKVKQLCLVATSPCFVQTEVWQNAMQKQLLQSFADHLNNDFAGTLSHFLALQFLGVKGIQKQLKQLRQQLLAQPPAKQALLEGLHILQSADFSQPILNQSAVTIPTHWILGALDRLVPISLAALLSRLNNTTVTTLAKAGHAPFISHPNEFIDAVLATLLDNHNGK